MTNARRSILTALATLCAAVGVLAFAGAPALAAGVRGEEGSFGPGGPGSGVFEELQSIAVEQSSGDVFVYQAGQKGIVYKFNAAGDKEDFSSTPTSNELKSVGGEAKESEIAVDNSSGSDKGDIYVATGEKLEIYTSAGKKEASLATKEEPCGVAVDPSGAVYVAFKEENTIRKYIPVTNPVKASNYTSSLSGVDGVCDIAADSAGDIYAAKTAGGVERYEASLFDTLPLTAIGTAVDAAGVTLALDPSSGGVGGELYIDEGSDVAEYVPPATRVASFGSLSKSYGVAEDHASGEVYAAEEVEEEGKVLIFGPSSEYPLTVRQAGFGAGTVQCEVGGGGAGACAGEYPKGTAVKLTATPGSGSELKGFSEACTNVSGPCEATIDAATSVTATFALEGVTEHTLTVKATGLGSVSASEGTISNCASGGGICSGSYPEGAEVELKPKLEQYYSVAWSGCTSVTPESVCIVKIGAANASVSASYEDTRTITVIPAGAGAGSVSAATGTIKDCAIDEGKVTGVCSGTYEEVEVFLSATLVNSTVTWSGGCEPNVILTYKCSVKPGTGDVTVTATFTPLTTDYTLAIDTTGGSGSGEVQCKVNGGAAGKCEPKYPAGTELTLVPKADGGSEFVAFSGGTGSAEVEACDGDTGECTFKLEADSGIDAPFDLIPGQHTLTIVTTGGSGSGTVQCAVGGGTAGPCAPSYPEGATVELSYVNGTHSSFEGWVELGSGIVTTPCVGKTSPCEVQMESNVTVDAPFELNTFPLTVTKAGTGAGAGTVTSVPAGIDCGATCKAPFEEESKVKLEAAGGSGSTFAGWSVAGQPGACTGTGACVVTISAAESVTASFTATVVAPGHEFLKSFGPEGPGLGPFIEDESIAVEQKSGDVYVYEGEEAGGFIYKFSAAEKPENFKSSGTNVIAYVGGEDKEVEIAVDSSNGPDHGDIYLATSREVEIFNENGEELAPLTTEEHKPAEEEPCGVAVDPSGAVYVMFWREDVKKYVPKEGTKPIVKADYESSLWGVNGTCNIAADSAGDVYAVNEKTGKTENEVTEYAASQFNTMEVPAVGSVIDSDSTASTVAVDPSGDDVYVDEGTGIAEYSSFPSGTRVGTFAEAAAGALHGSLGVAVSEESGEVYATYNASIIFNEEDENGGEVNVYAGAPAVGLPEVSIGSVSELQSRSATLNGTVDPGGVPVTACEFGYGTEGEYSHSVPCSEQSFSGDAPVVVSASVSGLEPDTTYSVRLSATNEEGDTNVSFGSFTTAGPGIAEESVTKVTSESALLSASINPLGLETEYHFEYDTSPYTGAAAHGTILPDQDIGSGAAAVLVSVPVQNLQAGAVYYYRVVASNEFGSVDGEGRTFTTQALGGEPALPDARQWELVSPPDKHGALLRPIGEQQMIQAAADGDAISYPTDFAPTEADAPGSGANGVQVFSARGAAGWSSRDISSPHNYPTALAVGFGEEYRFFSEDLSVAVVEAQEVGFTPHTGESLPEASERTPYLRHDATCEATPATCYEPLATGVPGSADVPPGTVFGGNLYTQIKGDVQFVDATPDASHVVVESVPPLTALAVEDAARKQLYEWVAGKFTLVSVLPGSAGKPAEGEINLGDENTNARHAISDDGSRIVWEAGSGGASHLYVRDVVSGQTVQLDAVREGTGAGKVDPKFQIASSGVSKVFFTDTQQLTAGAGRSGDDEPDLYVCELVETAGELGCKLTDLTPAGEVQGVVLGASEDGSDVYFVARGVLSGAENGERETASAGKDNLYMEHYDSGADTWTPTFIATLSGEDGPDWSAASASDLNGLTARVSPDGGYLAFMSQRELTGYDNIDVDEETGRHADEEVYLYDASSGRLVCASCDPTGTRPAGVEYGGGDKLVGGDRVWETGTWLAANIPGWTPFALSKALHQSRYLSDEGRLFFNSDDALVPQDVNGTWDVYEHEPAGVGDCAASRSTFSETSDGCVGLISSGTSPEESAFLDASESGGDVFFLTKSQLSSQDIDTALDVYDAHECTASSPCFPAPAAQPPPCETGDSCKPAPTPQPSIFGAPASATFSGAGNAVQPVSKPQLTAKPKPLTRAQKLTKALRACGRKPKRKRAECVKRARRRYGRKRQQRGASKKAKKSGAGERSPAASGRAGRGER